MFVYWISNMKTSCWVVWKILSLFQTIYSWIIVTNLTMSLVQDRFTCGFDFASFCNELIRVILFLIMNCEMCLSLQVKFVCMHCILWEKSVILRTNFCKFQHMFSLLIMLFSSAFLSFKYFIIYHLDLKILHIHTFQGFCISIA